MHALVGYVELGTDSWITNITRHGPGQQATTALTGCSSGPTCLMFVLRFFAGPIVHKISPLGLLFCSAVLGHDRPVAAGPGRRRTPPGCGSAAVTVYGIGKTFYWPTMLGVVSERFPQGGALTLGISGGIGMLSAGLLGGPGIGYKQDYAATQRAGRPDASADLRALQVRQAREPAACSCPQIAGLDNAKVGMLEDYEAHRGRR